MILVCVSLGVALWNSSIIYFYIVRFFGLVWNFILLWVGLSTVTPLYASNHFTQFSFGGGGSQVRQSILNVIWFATMREIWKEINNIIFNGKECSIMRIVDKIKLLSFLWLKEKFVMFSFNYHGWLLRPLAMLHPDNCFFFRFSFCCFSFFWFVNIV